MTNNEMIKKINELRKIRNAVILAHNYVLGEVQDIADYSGDSLELARIAAGCDAKVIVLCGVRFMAETAKILSPEKRVYLSHKDAGCPMAEQLPSAWQQQHVCLHPLQKLQ